MTGKRDYRSLSYPTLFLVTNHFTNMEKWVTVKEAAKFRRCSERNIIDLIQRERLQGRKNGRRWEVLIDFPEDYAEEVPQSAEVITVLKEQLQEKDKQIDSLQRQLEEASKRHDTIVLQMTRQLEQGQRLLEYHQEPWYRRWLNKAAKRGKQDGGNEKGAY